MKTRELMEVALNTGELLLRSGAEIYRVEDTINRIFASYKIDCECFVLLSGIFLSAKGDDCETISLIRRIKGHAYNLSAIEAVNNFSRNLTSNPISYDEAMLKLKSIENSVKYNLPVRLGAAGIMAFVYVLLFNGGIIEGFVALFISIITYFIKDKLSRMEIFQFFEYFVSGMIVGGLSLISTRFIPDLNIYKMISGAVMILVPGMALTNGIKDALYGDTVSSLYRLTEALFISVAVGAGVAIMLSAGFSWR